MTVLWGIPHPCPKCGGSGILGGSVDEGGVFLAECYHCDGTGDDPNTELEEGVHYGKTDN